MISTLVGIGTVLMQLSIILAWAVYLIPASSFSRFDWVKTKFSETLADYYERIGLFLSASAVLGSFYFSEFLNMVPCELCWYQRILIFPMPLIFFISIFLDKERVEDYIMPMSIIGLFIAIYNYYLQVSSASMGCSTAVSCSSVQLQALGYVTVPVMSLTFFLAIISLSFYSYNKP